jgi:hypothetical protein
LSATSSATGVVLDWANNAEADLAGYAVYRAASAGGPFVRLTPTPVSASAWEDTLAPAGTSHFRVTALNTTAGESTPSATANAAMAKANRLLNPGFETDSNTDGRPDSWTSSARFTRNTASTHSETVGGRHNGTANNYTISQARTGLTAGTTYDFAGWVNIPATSDAFTFRFDIQWRNSNNVVIATQTVATYTGATGGWVKAAGSYVAPAGTTRMQLHMIATSLSATVHVDDLAFR